MISVLIHRYRNIFWIYYIFIWQVQQSKIIFVSRGPFFNDNLIFARCLAYKLIYSANVGVLLFHFMAAILEEIQ